MTKIYRSGAVGALLDIYEKALVDLKKTIEDISDAELVTIVDNKTSNPKCRSVQAILSHVVSSGYGDAVDIRRLKGEKINYPDNVFRITIKDYIKDLDELFAFILDTFKNIS